MTFPSQTTRRLLLAASAAAVTARPARAAKTVRFARQFSMGYLQFNIMERERLLEKHAAAMGLDGVAVEWPAAGLVDTEIRFSNRIGGFHATTSVQPRVQA